MYLAYAQRKRLRKRLAEFAIWRPSWWKEVFAPTVGQTRRLVAGAFRGGRSYLYLQAVEYRRREEREVEGRAIGASGLTVMKG